MMADALFGALGKVGSPLKLVMVGTLAPMAAGPGHWWYDLIEAGTVDTTHVTAFPGRPCEVGVSGWRSGASTRCRESRHRSGASC